jgi:hypothetical protein
MISYVKLYLDFFEDVVFQVHSGLGSFVAVGGSSLAATLSRPRLHSQLGGVLQGIQLSGQYANEFSS